MLFRSQSTGCDKCVSLSLECRYEGRRKKRATTGSVGTLSTNETAGSDQERGPGQGTAETGAHEAQQRMELDTGWLSQTLADMSKDTQLTVDGQLSAGGNDGGSNESATGDFEDWMDMDAFFLSPLTAVGV